MLILYGLGIIILYLICFFYLYVLVMGIYRAYLSERLNRFLLVICLPVLVLGILFDVVANLTIATVVFRKLPREWLVTTRLIKIQNNPLEHVHNKALAKYICEHMLDVFDPNGNHC